MHAIVASIGGKELTSLIRGTGLISIARSLLRERCLHAISLVARALTQVTRTSRITKRAAQSSLQFAKSFLPKTHVRRAEAPRTCACANNSKSNLARGELRLIGG